MNSQEADLDQLNRTYRPALMTFFLRRLRSHAEAEDLTQDVFLRLARVERDAVQSPAAYIFGIAANLLRDRARREQIRFEYRGMFAADPMRGIDEIDPDRVVSGREALANLQSALNELPRLTRRLFILHRIENISRRDLAAAYGLSQAAVDRHLAKAMAHLVARAGETRP